MQEVGGYRGRLTVRGSLPCVGELRGRPFSSSLTNKNEAVLRQEALTEKIANGMILLKRFGRFLLIR